MRSVLLRIWGVIAAMYIGSLIFAVYWSEFVYTVREGFEYLDQISGGFATPTLIVLLIAGSVATLFIYSNIVVQTRKEALAIIVAGGTMYSNVFESGAEREARKVLSQLKPMGNIRLVLFDPEQRDIGKRERRVR